MTDISALDTLELDLPDAVATDALGRALAATQPAEAMVHLRGDLGAGKSTLARAWLRALGVTGTIRSPTYTLVERYPLPATATGPSEALHLDLYRIGDPGELEFLGLDDVERALWLVEWPERGARTLAPADLLIRLELVEQELIAQEPAQQAPALHESAGVGRRCRLQAEGDAGRAWLARLRRGGRGSELPALAEP